MTSALEKITLLVTTINKNEEQIVDICLKNNLRGNVIVGCQKMEHNNEKMLHFKEEGSVTIFFQTSTGVSINRNTLLKAVKTQYCIFLDDDILLLDCFEDVFLQALEKYPSFDVCFFGLSYKDKTIKRKFKKRGKLKKHNLRSFGVNSVVFRTSFLEKNNLLFDEKLGPGTSESSGEDVDFLYKCYEKTKEIYGYPTPIIEISYENGSTWFNGYDESFFRRLGISYHKHYGLFANLLIVYTILKHKKLYCKKISFLKALKISISSKKKTI